DVCSSDLSISRGTSTPSAGACPAAAGRAPNPRRREVTFKTPEEYLDSIQDGRVFFARGERITNVVEHPLTRPEALHYANDYTRFHRDDLIPYFTIEDPDRPGQLVDRFMVMPRNADEILAPGKA